MLRRRLTREARRPPPAVASDSYDDVPYAGAAFPQTHPDRLVTLARLYGGEPQDVERSRVLELGCGDGGNLIPMAYVLPDATLVGFDLNAAAVEHGRRTIEELRLGNIHLHERRFEEAITQYTEALRIAPQFEWARRNLLLAQEGLATRRHRGE